MDWWAAAQSIGAMVLVSESGPSASYSLHTQGAVRIQEAAGVTVLNEPPLQLILSNGSGFWVGARPVAQSEADLGEELAGVPLFQVGYSGFYPAMTDAGEVLSVSVADEHNGITSEGNPGLKAVIAQFN